MCSQSFAVMAALPDNGVVDGLARLPVAHNGGLAMIRYAR